MAFHFVWCDSDEAVRSSELKSCYRPHVFSRLPACLFAVVAISGCRSPESQREPPALSEVEVKAIGFLQREVPKWSRENGCFSCHNNGDAARALLAALKLGYPVPASALADTTEWVSHPDAWSNNKGDPGFSDQRLADIQFAAALHSAQTAMPDSKGLDSQTTLRKAALRVAAVQDVDGSWRIEPQNPIGSPATYGTALATLMAWRILRAGEGSELEPASQKASNWLQGLPPVNVPAAAVVVMASVERGSGAQDSQLGNAIAFLKNAQTSAGGWGPYLDDPPEVFDTALALLALSRFSDAGIKQIVRRGRSFLGANQLPDGSWPATTRPPGGASYAQAMSTSGWATLALLATRER